MNKKELEAMMKRHGDTGGDLAAYLGVTRSTFSAKLNESNGREFTQGEILKIKARYDLNADELDTIFFAEKVS